MYVGSGFHAASLFQIRHCTVCEESELLSGSNFFLCGNIYLVESLDVQDVLQNSFEGRNILLQKNKPHLSQRHRNRLVHFVIAEVLKNCVRDLKQGEFEVIAKKIIASFPNECLAVYYTPSINKRNSETGSYREAGGKLIHKYYNLRRLTQVDKSPNNTTYDELSESEKSPEVTPANLEDSIQWLNSCEEPWKSTKYHWTRTFNYRRNKIENIYTKRISSAFEDWPVLKAAKGFDLIDLDFQLSKFTKEVNAISNFDNFFQRVSNVRPLRKCDYNDVLKSLLEQDELTECNKSFLQLILLCHMIPSNARIPQGKRKSWKPTCIETVDGIVAHVKAYGDIVRLKEDRHAYAISRKITVQPYVIVVGETEHVVNSVYVCIDEVMYEIPTFLEALDICFKSFHVFCAQYPSQSEHIWLMFQIGLYKFKTKWDKNILCVNEILSDIDSNLCS